MAKLATRQEVDVFSIEFKNQFEIIKKVLPPSYSFNIGVPNAGDIEHIYICGSIPALGEWNPEKAKSIKKNKRGAFNKTIRLEMGTEFEYKIICKKSWQAVEKGRYLEEIPNRHGKIVEEKNRAVIEVMGWRDME